MLGHFILDGYAIADEYRMTDPAGDLFVLGMNVRRSQTDLEHEKAERTGWSVTRQQWLAAQPGGRAGGKSGPIAGSSCARGSEPLPAALSLRVEAFPVPGGKRSK